MTDGLVAFLLAPFVGSVLAVLVRRLPAGRPVVFARSACEACGTPVRADDMVPLLSHLRLRGRCRACYAPIAAEHWQIELAAMAVVAFVLAAGADGARFWADCGLGWTLLALAWIDARTMLLPDALTLPLLLAGLAVTACLEPDEASDHAVAAALAYGSFRGLAWAYRRFRGRDGLGQGDAKLLAALAAWVGLEGLASVLLGAALLGLATALLLRGRALRATTAIPFGPCLALAGWAVRLHP